MIENLVRISYVTELIYYHSSIDVTLLLESQLLLLLLLKNYAELSLILTARANTNGNGMGDVYLKIYIRGCKELHGVESNPDCTS